MSIKAIDIKAIEIEEGLVELARDCHLCGEAFAVGIHESGTICSKCKELWQTIIKQRGVE